MLRKLFFQLSPYVKSSKLNIIVTFISVVMVSISLLLLGKVIQDFIDIAIYSKDLTTIYKHIFYAFLVVAAFSFSSFLRSYNLGVVNEKIVSDIRLKIYEQIMSKEADYLENIKITDILDKVANGVKLIEQIISNILSFLFRNVILFLASTVLMFRANAKLAAIFFIAIPLISLPILLLNRLIKKHNVAFYSSSNNLLGLFEESLNNFKVVKVFNQNSRLVANFKTLTKEITTLNNTRQKFKSIFFGFIIFSLLAFIVAMILWGGIEVINGRLAPGKLVAFMFYAVLMATSVIGILEPLTSLSTQIEGINQLFALIKADDLDDAAKDKNYNHLKSSKLAIDVSNLSFVYNLDNKIQNLSDVSLKIRQGSFTAITGPSGSGKSTLVKLLLNLYPGKYSGNIDIYLNESSLIAYAPQDPMLFSVSIKDNIQFGSGGLNNEELEKIIELTELTELVRKFGLDDVLTNKAGQLSGGQKQQIALARALAAQPSILVCDEATSAMDFNLERKILQNIREFMKGKTIIFVAHRINTIKDADQIIVMEKGKVLSRGQHEDLLVSCPLYCELATGKFSNIAEFSQ